MYTVKFNALQAMDLIIRIEQAVAGNEGLIAIAIKTAIRNGTPAIEIINMVKDMANDNETIIQDLLGVSLTHRIKLFS